LKRVQGRTAPELTRLFNTLDRAAVLEREETWGTKYTLRAYPVDPHQQFRFVTDLTVRGCDVLSRAGVRSLLPAEPFNT
jgi:small conductance mechanosensitive channel